MFTSLLYHALRIRGYRYVNPRYEKGSVMLSIRQESHTQCCSACCNRRVIRKSSQLRRFRSVPIGGQRVWMEFAVLRVWFADARRRFTRAFERYVLELYRFAAMPAVLSRIDRRI